MVLKLLRYDAYQETPFKTVAGTKRSKIYLTLNEGAQVRLTNGIGF